MRIEDITLLNVLTPDTRRRVLVMRRFSAGEVIFHQGSETTGLWVVLNGRVAIEHFGAQGNLATSGIWVAGDVVGIAGLWDKSGYPGSARALDTPTELVWIDRQTAITLHQSVPAFAMTVSQLLAERLRVVQESVASRQGRPIILQLAIVLSMLGRKTEYHVRLTHEDLAHLIGTRRETISRVLQELQRMELIEVGYGDIFVKDADRLEALALEPPPRSHTP